MAEDEGAYDPAKDNLKLQYDLAQVEARREVWEPRFAQFQAQSSLRTEPSGHRPGWTSHGVDYTGPQYGWMQPENLGDYVLFLLDQMERAGGAELEKEGQRELAATGARPGSQDGGHILGLRLSEIGMEVEWWGDAAHTEFQQVVNSQGAARPAQRKFLTPRLAPLVAALDRRA